MPSFSIALASARMPSPEVFSERKSSSMMTMGKRNFMQRSCGLSRAAEEMGRIVRRPARRMCGVRPAGKPAERAASALAPAQQTGARPPQSSLGVRDDDGARPARASPSPSGVRRRRPQGRFFSAAMTAASTSIQPRLPVPTTNMRSISAQQQPTQNRPWSTPRRHASRARCAAVPARHDERERRVALLEAAVLERAELEERPRPASTTAPTTQPWVTSQGVAQPRTTAAPRRPRARRGRTRTRRRRSPQATSADEPRRRRGGRPRCGERARAADMSSAASSPRS